jgi:hypothetical protein
VVGSGTNKQGRLRVTLALAIAMAALVVSVSALSAAEGTLEIEIQISPHVLNASAYGEEVTVHTDIPYASVDHESVTLSGVKISGYKADDCGDFVAKFQMSAILALDLAIGERNEFVLEGKTVDGTAFAGEEAILVVSNRGAQGRTR